VAPGVVATAKNVEAMSKSNQDRENGPIPVGDWQLAALQETVMAYERETNGALVTVYLTAIACLEDIVKKTLPLESDGWQRLDELRKRVDQGMGSMLKSRTKGKG
jgi:hypothetical protein